MDDGSSKQVLAKSCLDMLIAAAYLAIALLMTRLAMTPVQVLDFHKFTSQMSREEKKLVRYLLIAFAVFISVCGAGHAVAALSSLSPLPLLSSLQFCIQFLMAVASVGTSLYVQRCLPKLLKWLNEIEIHRKGVLSGVVQQAEVDDFESKVSGHAKSTEDELRAQIARLERQISMQEVRAGGVGQDRGPSARRAAEIVEQMRPELLNLSRQDWERPPAEIEKAASRHGLDWSQTAKILAAVRALQLSRKEWSKNPDGTWGAFAKNMDRVVRKDKDDTMPIGAWHSYAKWSASQEPKKLGRLITAAMAFHKDPRKETVVGLSSLLETSRQGGSSVVHAMSI